MKKISWHISYMFMAGVVTLNQGRAAESGVNYLIMLPQQCLSDASKEIVLRSLNEVFVTLRPSSALVVAAAPSRLLTRIDISESDTSAANRNVLIRRYGAQLEEARKYVSSMACGAAERNPGEVKPVESLSEVGRTIKTSLPQRQTRLLMLGNWLHDDPLDQVFSMTDNMVMSDGHFKDRASPFTTVGKEKVLGGIQVHACVTPGYPDQLQKHKERTQRFWGLYVAKQGGKLATYTSDVATCFARFKGGQEEGQTEYTANDADGFYRMKVNQSAIVPEEKPQPPTRAAPPATANELFTAPLSTQAVPMGNQKILIGIQWSGNADIDLYCRDRSRSAEYMSYQKEKISGVGRYMGDHTKGMSDRSVFEMIEFEGSKFADVECMVHNYSRSGKYGGRIRVQVGAHVYEGEFEAGNDRRSVDLTKLTRR